MFKEVEKKGKDPESSTEEKSIDDKQGPVALFHYTLNVGLICNVLHTVHMPSSIFLEHLQGVQNIVSFESLYDKVTENVTLNHIHLFEQGYEICFRILI